MRLSRRPSGICRRDTGLRPSRARLSWGAMLLLAALGAFVSSSACREDPQAKAELEAAERAALRRYNGLIVFVGSCERDPLWPILKASAQRYDQEMCMLEVRYLCPRNESPQEQIDLLKSVAGNNLRGVCVQIDNPPAVERALRELYGQGVQIVSMIKPAPQDIRAAHVGFDDAEVGAALGRAVVEVVGGKGTIMLVHAGTKDPVYSQRLAGFSAEMDRNRDIEILAEIDCRMDAFDARKIIRERSERFPRLSCWVSLDDWPLRGLGLLDKPLPAGCRLVTFGAYPHQWPLIREGSLPIVVAGDYQEMGRQALEACEVAARNTTRLKPTHTASIRTVHPGNLDEFISDWSSWLQVGEEKVKPAQSQSASALPEQLRPVHLNAAQ